MPDTCVQIKLYEVSGAIFEKAKNVFSHNLLGNAQMNPKESLAKHHWGYWFVLRVYSSINETVSQDFRLLVFS
jgi:hypothetical protein